MSLKHWCLAVPIVSFALGASTGAAQEPAQEKTAPPAGESVGEKVDSAVQTIKKGFSSAGDAVRDQFEKVRTGVHNMSVATRVYGRLHWDKALTDAKLEVDVQKGGVTVLAGTVADAAARAKAVMLTQETVGVTKVVDRLRVQTIATGAAPSPENPTKP